MKYLPWHPGERGGVSIKNSADTCTRPLLLVSHQPSRFRRMVSQLQPFRLFLSVPLLFTFLVFSTNEKRCGKDEKVSLLRRLFAWFPFQSFLSHRLPAFLSFSPLSGRMGKLSDFAPFCPLHIAWHSVDTGHRRPSIIPTTVPETANFTRAEIVINDRCRVQLFSSWPTQATFLEVRSPIIKINKYYNLIIETNRTHIGAELRAQLCNYFFTRESAKKKKKICFIKYSKFTWDKIIYWILCTYSVLTMPETFLICTAGEFPCEASLWLTQ